MRIHPIYHSNASRNPILDENDYDQDIKYFLSLYRKYRQQKDKGKNFNPFKDRPKRQSKDRLIDLLI